MTPASPAGAPRADPDGRVDGGGGAACPDGAAGGDAAAVLAAVEELRRDLGALRLPLEVTGAAEARAAQRVLVAQLDDHLLPRLRRLDAPLLAVVGGSTGAGKSTLVNSVVGHRVSEPGVLRPTTRRPTLVHHPEDTRWFTSAEVLPGLARTTGEAPDQSTSGSGLHLVPDAALPPGLALLDAPDVDSVVEANRDLAAQLLGAADLWLFVTTASRYADAVPWAVLRGAVERGTSVAVVLDRVPPEALDVVRTDLARLLVEGGLVAAPLFVVPETRLVDGLLPRASTAALADWLQLLGSDARHRDLVVRRTLAGALAALQGRVDDLAGAARAQREELAALDADLDAVYAGSTAALEAQLTDGTLLRGEVLARWQEFVGTGEFLRSLQAVVGRARDRALDALRHRPAPVERLDEALTSGVAALVLDAVAQAREASLLRWRARPAGAALLAAAPAEVRDARVPDRVAPRVERLVRDWQGGVLELVREQGQGKRTRARMLSLGVSGAGAVLMLVVFAGSAGVTGAEVGIAAGTTALAQKVLEAVFGDQAVRRLADAARADLLRRVRELVAEERAVHQELLPELDDDLVERLGAGRAAVAALPPPEPEPRDEPQDLVGHEPGPASAHEPVQEPVQESSAHPVAVDDPAPTTAGGGA